MPRPLALLFALAGLATGPSACAKAEGQAGAAAPVYRGAEPVGLGGDLYGFLVTMEGARDGDEVEAYVTCAVAGFALEKNYRYARRVRTKVTQEAGVWIADAVYTISPTEPRGLMTIDAAAQAADCAERGIPTA
ncbi:hypothetical protein [Albidovulum sp.]